MKEIGSGAFAYCSSLKSFDIPDGVEDIASQTFLECRSLSSVKIPDSVEKIRNTAFAQLQSTYIYRASCSYLKYWRLCVWWMQQSENRSHRCGFSSNDRAGDDSRAFLMISRIIVPKEGISRLPELHRME